MISIDASVMVKWFKKGEEKEKLALRLKDDVLSRRITLVVNEYVFLEVIRAMTKAGYPGTKVEETIDFLNDLETLGFVDVVSVEEVRRSAMSLIYSLNLYASDALILATALKRKTNLITEDTHLLKKSIKNYAKKRGVKVLTLEEFFQAYS